MGKYIRKAKRQSLSITGPLHLFSGSRTFLLFNDETSTQFLFLLFRRCGWSCLASSWTDYSFSRRVLFFQKAGFRAYTKRRWVGLRGAMEASFPLAWAHHLWLTTTGKAHFPPAADSPGLFLPPVLGLDHAHNGFLLIGVATHFIFHRLLHFHLQSRRHSAFRNDNDLLPVTSPSHQLLGNFFPSSGKPASNLAVSWL